MIKFIKILVIVSSMSLGFTVYAEDPYVENLDVNINTDRYGDANITQKIDVVFPKHTSKTSMKFAAYSDDSPKIIGGSSGCSIVKEKFYHDYKGWGSSMPVYTVSVSSGPADLDELNCNIELRESDHQSYQSYYELVKVDTIINKFNFVINLPHDIKRNEVEISFSDHIFNNSYDLGDNIKLNIKPRSISGSSIEPIKPIVSNLYDREDYTLKIPREVATEYSKLYGNEIILKLHQGYYLPHSKTTALCFLLIFLFVGILSWLIHYFSRSFISKLNSLSSDPSTIDFDKQQRIEKLTMKKSTFILSTSWFCATIYSILCLFSFFHPFLPDGGQDADFNICGLILICLSPFIFFALYKLLKNRYRYRKYSIIALPMIINLIMIVVAFLPKLEFKYLNLFFFGLIIFAISFVCSLAVLFINLRSTNYFQNPGAVDLDKQEKLEKSTKNEAVFMMYMSLLCSVINLTALLFTFHIDSDLSFTIAFIGFYIGLPALPIILMGLYILLTSRSRYIGYKIITFLMIITSVISLILFKSNQLELSILGFISFLISAVCGILVVKKIDACYKNMFNT